MFDETLKSEIIQIAKDNDLEPATLFAVVEVESAGKLGAKVNGRMEPLIRIEGHYFYRLLPNGKRNRAVVAGLASSKAGRVKNPIRQAARWRMLKRAEDIDRPAALASCSWGCGQVMGSHWRWLGYASIDALVAEARDGAGGQVRLMMRYIKKAGLIEKLQNHDWAGFARAYNGPGYRKYKYDRKMLAAYKRHASRFSISEVSMELPARNCVILLRFGSVGQNVRELQRKLPAGV
ncbi:MAG: N-acetylmuramidase family protein [Pseudomonadota bacterium]